MLVWVAERWEIVVAVRFRLMSAASVLLGSLVRIVQEGVGVGLLCLLCVVWVVACVTC